jgi:hypothetical protein
MTELSTFEKAMGWRKRQMVESQVERNEIIEKIRNDTLDEVALEFEKMKAFGDTAHSFATFVRNMKHEQQTKQQGKTTLGKGKRTAVWGL